MLLIPIKANLINSFAIGSIIRRSLLALNVGIGDAEHRSSHLIAVML
jgi:hypothetical protein